MRKNTILYLNCVYYNGFGMQEETVEGLVKRFVKTDSVVALGTSPLAETFLRKLALQANEAPLQILFVPTSMRLAALSAELHLEITSIDEHEIDVAIEFADQLDNMYNFLKSDSQSLVRDKMIAQSAVELIVIAQKKNLVSKLHGVLAFEIVSFGAKRTLTEIGKFGKTVLKQENGQPFKTESGNLMALTQMDAIYSLEDIEFQAKQIPGVVETGLFLGYADRMILYNPGVEAKSRMRAMAPLP